MSLINCSDEIKKIISQGLDLIVFDVDGVLIDTMPSFISTIVVTTKYYINDILKISMDLSELTEDDVMLFKKYSGFNNDWNLTESMIIFNLFVYKTERIDLSLKEFLDEVDGFGGGLDGISLYLKKHCEDNVLAWISEKVESRLIRKTFREFYGGRDYCERLYGFTPDDYDGAGSVESEVILLDTGILDRWEGKVGILTGRMENETMLAIEMINSEKINTELVQFTDDILPDKPHPAKMERILDISGSVSALYVGDSIDDFLTAFNFNKLGRKNSLIFGLVTADSDSFPEEARKFQADTVNDLLEYVIKNNKKS
ncbi:HAD family hydrolase [candidate division KSB1 bacterium]